MTTPTIESIMAFKGIYVLNTIDRYGQLKATHYTCVLVGGPQPVWGVWTISGRFSRFFTFRSEVERAYPELVWRRKAARWQMAGVLEKQKTDDKRAELAYAYGAQLPEKHDQKKKTKGKRK